MREEDRLFKAIESSYKSLLPFRQLNKALVDEYTGHNYGTYSGAPKRKKYYNDLFRAINGHIMLLAANRPQIMVQTEFRHLKPFARHYQAAVNNLIKEIKCEKTIRDWVLSAMFCLGIVKVHLADSGVVMQELDITADPGCPFASNVFLDDWVHDMGVKRYPQVKYAGDMYRIPFRQLEEGINDGTYDEEATAELVPTSKFEVEQDRVDQISRGAITDLDEFEPMIDLADIWIPSQRLIKTYAVESRRDFRLKGRPISVMEWDGIETGPYHLLSYSDVPENIMPSSPASHWEALDEFLNISLRKKSRQTNRMKEVLCATSAGTSTAKALKNASDGDVLPNVLLETVKAFRMGGSDPSLDNTIAYAKQLFSEVANNLDAILGTGPQAETLGQEELIQSAGNRMAAQMQYRVIEATTEMISNLGCLLWKDEFKEIAANIEFEDGVEPQYSPWKPGDREGNFQQYNFNIVLNSMVHRSPAQQSNTVTQLLTTVYLPALQLMVQQGISIDFAALTKMFAELLYLPELMGIITVQGVPVIEDQSPSTQVAGKSPVTSRTYTRKSAGANGGMPTGNQLIHQQPAMNGSANGSAGNSWSGNNGGWQ